MQILVTVVLTVTAMLALACLLGWWLSRRDSADAGKIHLVVKHGRAWLLVVMGSEEGTFLSVNDLSISIGDEGFINLAYADQEVHGVPVDEMGKLGPFVVKVFGTRREAEAEMQHAPEPLERIQ